MRALSYLRQSASLCTASEKQLRRKVLYHYLKCLVQLKHYATAATLIPVLLSITAERYKEAKVLCYVIMDLQAEY